jgi:hypothetical protein
MKNPIVLSFVLSFLHFICISTGARAEPIVAESLETILAASDRVVVGKVSNIEDVLDSQHKQYQVLTVEISKTIKGSTEKTVSFVMPAYIERLYATQWREEGIPIIFCLKANNGKRVPFSGDRFKWVIRDDGNGSCTILLGKSKNYWTGCKPAFTCNFDVLTEPRALLEFVESTVKVQRNEPITHYYSVAVPGGSAAAEQLANPWSRNWLIVPVDKKLEALGLTRCASKSPIYREEGAKIVGHFKSDKNIKILKTLLEDSSTSDCTLHQTVPGKEALQLVYRKKVYSVRKAAFESLQMLGVNVDRPVLEELLESRDEPG